VKTFKKLTFLSLSVTIALFFIPTTSQSMGSIIFLNGTSSAGKSSIVRNLQGFKCLSWDTVKDNLEAEWTERVIANLQKRIVEEIEVENIKISPESADYRAWAQRVADEIKLKIATLRIMDVSDEGQYTLPRNDSQALEEKQKHLNVLFKQYKVYPALKLEEDEEMEISGKIEEIMCEEAKLLASMGENVVIDTAVSDTDEDMEFQRHKDFLQGSDVHYVLVYCPILELVNRVRSRNSAGQDGAINAEYRKLEGPLSQFRDMYKVADDPSEEVLDVLDRESVELAFERGLDLFGEKFRSKQRVPILKKTILGKFNSSPYSNVMIIPQGSYNLVVNNGPEGSPEECAKQILELLERE